MILIDLPWKLTEIFLSFLWLYPSTTFFTLLLTMRPTPFLLRNVCAFSSILFHWFQRCQWSILPSPAWPHPIYLNSRTYHSRYLCNIFLCSIRFYFHSQTQPQLSFPLCPSQFILSGANSNCPLVFPSTIVDTWLPGALNVCCNTFLTFHTVHGVLMAKILEGVSISSSVDHFCQNPSLCPVSLGWPHVACTESQRVGHDWATSLHFTSR